MYIYFLFFCFCADGQGRYVKRIIRWLLNGNSQQDGFQG